MRLYELSSKSVVVMFAYSNPPSKEYDIYFKELLERSRNTDHIVYLNPMVDSEINPLSFVDNLRFNRIIFPNINFSSKKEDNILKIIKDLAKKYTDVIMLVKKEDKNIYEQYTTDAESVGILNYIVEVIKEQHDYNIEARQAVLDNDYSTFITKIPTTNKNILSQLFITLRKTMRLNGSKKLNESANTKHISKSNIITDALKHARGIDILDSMCTFDKFGNKVYQSDKHNQNIIEMKNLTDVQIGFDKMRNKTAIFVPELTESYLSKNEERICELLENTVASNVSSTASFIGEPIKRIDNITGILPQVKNEQDKLSAAIRVFINTHGYINSDIIEKIQRELDNEI